MRQDSMVIALERLDKALEALRTIQLGDAPFPTYSAVFHARLEIAQVAGMLTASLKAARC
jgi:hypothetical protein